MTITREEINNLEQIAKDAQKELRAARRAFAVQECPLKVGQEVISIGHAHTGAKMVILRISYTASPHFDGDWMVFGNILKKDGTPSRRHSSFNHAQWLTSQDKK